MKIQQKVIFYPLLIMVVTFMIGLVGVEYQVKQTWVKQVDKELKVLSLSTLTSIGYIKEQVTAENERSALGHLSQKQTQQSDIRLSIINDKGKLVADSMLSEEEIISAGNYLALEEINKAQVTGNSRVVRFSDFFAKSTVFITHFDGHSGYYVRASTPIDTYQVAIHQIRKGFIAVVVIAVVTILSFGYFLRRTIQEAVDKERSIQDIRVADKTREITLLQTMMTMLNAAENFDETGQVILSIMPRLLPDLSGKLYLLNDNDELKDLISWGPELSENVSILPVNPNDNKTEFITEQKELPEHLANYQTSRHLICVDLIDQNKLFGVIHFLGSRDKVHDKNIRNIVMQLSEQISLGLTNLRVKKQLHYQAIRDPLTNLYNRRFMLEGFEQAINRAERHDLSLAVLMIDIDHFKAVNDKFGHKMGDAVLVAIAELFKTNLRLEDIACRFGGEEFCIICPDTKLKDAFTLAEKLRLSTSELNIVEQDLRINKITISTGIAVFPNHGQGTQQLINEADKALYIAKNRGRNNTVVAANSQVEHNQ
ncbi:sensor domain-containing diguanylate cyclase [Thalassotalea atypica]|uniref:sensor domain-containing diguanylate cyclase n=1 Tax=Thalassotalea atypica TaxID=2054316 RepID=UPI002572F289|nr:sensor domain-containing diguanylate cyclase [Thalassotalea atypica]